MYISYCGLVTAECKAETCSNVNKTNCFVNARLCLLSTVFLVLQRNRTPHSKNNLLFNGYDFGDLTVLKEKGDRTL